MSFVEVNNEKGKKLIKGIIEVELVNLEKKWKEIWWGCEIIVLRGRKELLLFLSCWEFKYDEYWLLDSLI